MKSFLILVIYCVVSIHSAVYFEISPSDTPPNKCKSIYYDLGVMNVDEEKQVPNECMVAKCHKNGVMSFAGCGAISDQENCTLVKQDLSKPYPECCETYDCP